MTTPKQYGTTWLRKNVTNNPEPAPIHMIDLHTIYKVSSENNGRPVYALREFNELVADMFHLSEHIVIRRGRKIMHFHARVKLTQLNPQEYAYKTHYITVIKYFAQHSYARIMCAGGERVCVCVCPRIYKLLMNILFLFFQMKIPPRHRIRLAAEWAPIAGPSNHVAQLAKRSTVVDAQMSDVTHSDVEFKFESLINNGEDEYEKYFGVALPIVDPPYTSMFDKDIPIDENVDIQNGPETLFHFGNLHSSETYDAVFKDASLPPSIPNEEYETFFGNDTL